MTTFARSWALLLLAARCRVAGHDKLSIETLRRAGATCLKNETFIGPARGNRWISSSKTLRGAPPCRAPSYRLSEAVNRRSRHVGCERESTTVVIGHDILSTCRRFLRGQSRQGFADGMFVSRRTGNRRCVKAGFRRLSRASLHAEAPVMHPHAIAMVFGTEAMLQL